MGYVSWAEAKREVWIQLAGKTDLHRGSQGGGLEPPRWGRGHTLPRGPGQRFPVLSDCHRWQRGRLTKCQIPINSCKQFDLGLSGWPSSSHLVLTDNRKPKPDSRPLAFLPDRTTTSQEDKFNRMSKRQMLRLAMPRMMEEKVNPLTISMFILIDVYHILSSSPFQNMGSF